MHKTNSTFLRIGSLPTGPVTFAVHVCQLLVMESNVFVTAKLMSYPCMPKIIFVKILIFHKVIGIYGFSVSVYNNLRRYFPTF